MLVKREVFVSIILALLMVVLFSTPAFAQAVTLDVDPAGESDAGETVTLTANVEDVDDPEYQFGWRIPGGTWNATEVKADSTHGFAVPINQRTIDVQLGVQVREAGETEWLTSDTADHTVKAVEPSVSLTIDPTDTAAEGQEVTFTAQSENVVNPEYRFIYRPHGGTKLYFPQEGSDNIWTETAPLGSAGTWDFGVQVKEAGGSWLTHDVVEEYVIKEEPVEPEPTIFDEEGTYGPEDEADPDTIVGDVIVKADGVTLRNFIITGDLIIAEEVGDGEVILNNLEVKGELIIRGGGADSIYVNGGEYSNIRIEEVDGGVRVVAVGVTGPDGEPVDVVIAEGALGEDIILEGDFNEINIDAENSTVNICATVNQASINADGVTVNLFCAEAEIDHLNVNGENATVEGDGTINTADVNADGATFQEGIIDPDDVTVGDGVEDPVYFDPDPDPDPGPDPVPTYTLTVTAEPAGYGTVVGAGNYPAGVAVDINATADTDKYFFMWQAEPDIGSFGDPYEADTTFTMPAQDVTITAYFSDTDDPVYNKTQGTGHETIQGAIDADTTAAGDTILVAAGEYVEALYIDFDLTLLGAGRDVTTIQAPDSITYRNWGSGSSPIIAIDGAEVNISGFTVDGLRKGETNANLHGVHFWEASGSLTNSRVTGIRHEPLSGAQNVNAVSVNHTFDALIEHSVDIENNIIDDYQKTGIVVNEPGATANIVGNTITGYGPTDVIAQNGIQFGYGLGNPVDGTVTGNIVTNNWYTDEGWSSSGILMVGVDAITVSNNVFNENQHGIDLYYDSSWGSEETTDIIINENEITNSLVGLRVDKECEVKEAINNTFNNNDKAHVSAQDDSIIDLDAIFANNTFPPIAAIVGNTIQDILPEKVYNLDTGYVGTEIQDVIDHEDTDDGNTILVATGNYEEQITIDKPLKLIGPNADKEGVSPERGPEAVIKNNDPLGSNIQIASTDVTVSGFTIEGGEDQLNGIYFNETYAEHKEVNVTVKNNRILKFGSQGSSDDKTVRYDEYGRGIYFANGDVRDGNTHHVYGIKIQGNYVQYAEGGIVLKHDSYAEVSNNKIEDCYTGIFVEWFARDKVEELDSALVESHTIHNNTIITGDDYGWNENTGFKSEDSKTPKDACMGMRLNVIQSTDEIVIVASNNTLSAKNPENIHAGIVINSLHGSGVKVIDSTINDYREGIRIMGTSHPRDFDSLDPHENSAALIIGGEINGGKYGIHMTQWFYRPGYDESEDPSPGGKGSKSGNNHAFLDGDIQFFGQSDHMIYCFRDVSINLNDITLTLGDNLNTNAFVDAGEMEDAKDEYHGQNETIEVTEHIVLEFYGSDNDTNYDSDGKIIIN